MNGNGALRVQGSRHHPQERTKSPHGRDQCQEELCLALIRLKARVEGRHPRQWKSVHTRDQHHRDCYLAALLLPVSPLADVA